MSNPQLENGYLKIANELWDAVAVYGFKKNHRAVIDAVIRKTYGYRKATDDISLSQLEMMTRIDASNCGKALRELISLNVITKTAGKYGQNLGLNKHYRTWQNWDVSWEWWNKTSETEQESVKPEIILTDEQIACWQWAKNHDFWQDKVATKSDFLKVYKRQGNGVKNQYEAFKSNPEKPKYRGKKKPADFELQDFDDVQDTGSGDFINGEFERMK
jgi:phage replication O-like protein O